MSDGGWPEEVTVVLAVADGGTDDPLLAYVDPEAAAAAADDYNTQWSIRIWEPNWQYTRKVRLVPPTRSVSLPRGALSHVHPSFRFSQRCPVA